MVDLTPFVALYRRSEAQSIDGVQITVAGDLSYGHDLIRGCFYPQFDGVEVEDFAVNAITNPQEILATPRIREVIRLFSQCLQRMNVAYIELVTNF